MFGVDGGGGVEATVAGADCDKQPHTLIVAAGGVTFNE